MTTWNFQLGLNRALSADEVDALRKAGLADAAIQSDPVGVLDVDRESETLQDAILSAVRQVESVGELEIVEIVGPDSLATILGLRRQASE